MGPRDRINRAGTLFLTAVGLTAVAGLANVLAGHFLRGGVDKWAFGYPMYLVDAYGYVWGYSLINVVSALGIICALQRIQPSTLLANPALVRIGKVSYGVYFYHLPLLLPGRWCFVHLGFQWNRVSNGIFFLIFLAVVLAVAEASFRWLETPFLRLKDLGTSQLDTAGPGLQAEVSRD